MEFVFRPGELGSRGESVYGASELSLEYIPAPQPRRQLSLSEQIDHCFGIAPRNVLIIADTLTIVFGGSDKTLLSLDAYTNASLWDVAPVARLPKIEGQGSLRLMAVPEHAEHIDVGIVPTYELSTDGPWVRIKLLSEAASVYYEVGSHLVVGLAGAMLADIYLLQVRFTE